MSRSGTQFGTRDREYTAQILKRVYGAFRNEWKIVGNTTIIIHEPLFPPSKYTEDMAAFRRQMMYGANITRPKFGFGSFTAS